jgi:hypothetical protein
MDRRKFSKTVGLVAVAASVPGLIFAKNREMTWMNAFRGLPRNIQHDLIEFFTQLEKRLSVHPNHGKLMNQFMAPASPIKHESNEVGYSCSFQNQVGNLIEISSNAGITRTFIS